MIINDIDNIIMMIMMMMIMYKVENGVGVLQITMLLHFKYRKILKISPGAYIFQRPFLKGLFLEGPIFGGAI